MFEVTSRVPTRVDLAGGTLDINPLFHLLEHKATVNMGVNVDAVVRVRSGAGEEYELTSADLGVTVTGSRDQVLADPSLPLVTGLLRALWQPGWPALSIHMRAASPAGAGLGGSSALGVALAAALARAAVEVDPDQSFPAGPELVALVQNVETALIRVPTGCQDYWGAWYGGYNIIRYPPAGVRVQNLPMTDLPELGEQLLLVYSGVSRASATNNWDIFREAFAGNQGILDGLNAIGLAAERAAAALEAGDTEGLLAASAEEWSLRRKLWPSIETGETRAIDQACRRAGAGLVRICGAGGGGVMAVFCPPEKREEVARAARAAGGQILPGGPASTGLEVQPPP